MLKNILPTITLFAVVAVEDSDAAAAAVALGPELARTMGSVMEDDTDAENQLLSELISTLAQS